MSYKAVEIARELADELKKRITTMPVQVESMDANGNVVLTLSADATPAAGEKVAVIRVKPIDWSLAKDVLGNAQRVYTPDVIQLCTELNFAGTTDNVADILTATELLPLLGTILARGTRVEWHQTANGTVPSVAAIDAGTNLKASYEALLYWGMKASQ